MTTTTPRTSRLFPYTTLFRSLQGARQTAREPDLDLWDRLPDRLARRAVAERGGAEAPRAALPRAEGDGTGMTALGLALGAVLAVACVVFVALPFLREPDPVEDRLDEPGALERRALELAEERDRALAAL